MKVAILGGGISGLSAAWELQQRDPAAEITLFEKEDRLGGWIGTDERGFERGPRTFPWARNPHLLALIRELGLEKEIVPSSPSASKRYLWHRGKLISMGALLIRFLPLFLREPFIARGKEEDESIAGFATRRFNREIAELFFDPLTLGIYGGDMHKLSLRSCFPFLDRWEHKKGSLLLGFLSQKRGEKGLFTLRRGMGSLIEELQKKLSIEIRFHCPVEALKRDGVLAGEKWQSANRIISALPAPVLGRLTGLWSDFPTISLWIVHMAYREKVLTKEGFGYLVPSREKEPLLGMVWDSSLFPRKERATRLTAMIRSGGDAHRAQEIALDAARRHLGIAPPPSFIHPFYLSEAIPQFEVGYAKRLARFEADLKERFPSLVLSGNYLEGASVDACIRRARKVCK